MKNRTIHHLSHIDLDGYSCQLVMKYTPYTKFNYNANYVKKRDNRVLSS